MSEVIFTKKSGLDRAYYKPMCWLMPLPSIKNIIDNPDAYSDLMHHIALNHKGLNWKFYKFQLNAETYPVFLYSLAYCAKDLNPAAGYSWQIQKNANRISRYLSKNQIFLTHDEKEIIYVCKRFSNWKNDKAERKVFTTGIINSLNDYYSKSF